MLNYKKGMEFENVIEKIYKFIASNERMNVRIDRNVSMIGRDETRNEIDILFSYEHLGTNYRVAVECKNWKNPINKKELNNFAAKLETIGNINGIFISADSYFQDGVKKVSEFKGIKLIKFSELNKIVEGFEVEYMVPDFKTIGDPFWTFMNKNGTNMIEQNLFLRDGILLFESKYCAQEFQKLYLNNHGKNIELVGVSQNHLKEIICLKKQFNKIKVQMFNPYAYILKNQNNHFWDLDIEDLQMYIR